jgi:LemA protein
MIWVVLAIVAVLVVLVLWIVGMYNGLVRSRNGVDSAWAQIEVQLKRRWDLIPNLVETVKGYAAHERGTFEAVTQARTTAQQAKGPAATAQAEGILGQALGRLFAVAEAYPELKASQNFLELQGQLTDTENQVSTARQVYNSAVLRFNNAIQTFPAVILANSFGFAKREFFEVEQPTEREVPHVSFGATEAASAPAPADAAPPNDPPSG